MMSSISDKSTPEHNQILFHPSHLHLKGIQIQITMGSLCANCAKDEGTETDYHCKNSEELSARLGEYCQVKLINGNYRLHHADTLLVLCELKYLSNCLPLHEYTANGDKISDSLANTRKPTYKNLPTKNSPYQKVFLCALPTYKTEISVEYQQQFRSMLALLLQSSSDIVLELTNTVENMGNLPNQMLLSMLLQLLAQSQEPLKLQLLTNEHKMMNMYRYELLKTGVCSLTDK